MRSSSTIRTLILLATVLDIPVLAAVVRRLTPHPVAGVLRVGDTTVELVRPSGGGPWPTYVFISGAHPERRREPVVRRLMEGLARAGFLVAVPDPPGLAEGEITTATLDAVIGVMTAVLQRPEVDRGRVAILGASTGASLGLVAAADPDLRGRVSVVVAVTPFADLEKIICLATTNTYDDGVSQHTRVVDGLLRQGVIRSMVSHISDDHDRRLVLDSLMNSSAADRNELEGLELCLPRVGAEAQVVIQLLVNREAERFGALYDELPPDLHHAIRRLSPVSAAPHVRAPVELVVPPVDVYFPHNETLALAKALAHVRLTVTPTLDHTRPSASLKRLGAFVRFSRFVIRGLAAASSHR